jgi:uncharacterized membrane protein YccC
MPTWQPNWANVDFDFAGAEVAISECRMLRHVLEDRDPMLDAPLAIAREEWRGPKRIAFDEFEIELQRDVHRLIEELRSIEQRVSADITRANDEQVRRVRQRAQWSDELVAEQEAERRRVSALAVEAAARQKSAEAAAANTKQPPVAA